MSSVCGAAVVALGVAVLLGWSGGLWAVVSIREDWVSMKPVTALMFILIGAAAMIIQTRWQTLAIVHAALTGVLVVVSTAAAAVKSVGGLDGPLLSEAMDSVHTVSPGVPAIGTLLAFSLASFGATIGAIGNGPMRPLRRACGVLVVLFGAASLIGYVTGIDVLYWSVPGVSSAMALHTAVGLMMVGVAVVEMEPIKHFHPRRA